MVGVKRVSRCPRFFCRYRKVLKRSGEGEVLERAIFETLGNCPPAIPKSNNNNNNIPHRLYDVGTVVDHQNRVVELGFLFGDEGH